MLIESILVAAAVLSAGALAIYDVAAFRACRRAGKARERAAVETVEAILGLTRAEYAAHTLEPRRRAWSRPMDAWVDDALWRRLDEL